LSISLSIQVSIPISKLDIVEQTFLFKGVALEHRRRNIFAFFWVRLHYVAKLQKCTVAEQLRRRTAVQPILTIWQQPPVPDKTVVFFRDLAMRLQHHSG
jgi:hypothetical protein